MKEKKRRKKIFAAGIVLILIVVYAVRVMAVNTSYKKEEYTVQKGESIEVQGMRISVLEAEMKKMSAQSKWANLQDESEEGYDMVLTVQYENISDQPISRCIVSETMLQSGGWTNGMNGMHFMEINEESGDTSLKVGEKKILKVPFAMYSYQFQPKDWKKIEEREFVWVLTGAPVKNMILVNGE